MQQLYRFIRNYVQKKQHWEIDYEMGQRNHYIEELPRRPERRGAANQPTG